MYVCIYIYIYIYILKLCNHVYSYITLCNCVAIGTKEMQVGTAGEDQTRAYNSENIMHTFDTHNALN